MYTYILGALAIMGVIMVAGGVIYAVSTALGAMHLDRLTQSRELVLAKANVTQAEIETSMRLHQLELRRTALLEGAELPELPEAKEEVLEPKKKDVVTPMTPAIYVCNVCQTSAPSTALGLNCARMRGLKQCKGIIVKVYA